MNTYFYVEDGQVATPPEKLIWANGLEVKSSSFVRPYIIGQTSVGEDTSDTELVRLGVYPLIIVGRGEAPGADYIPVTGELVVEADHVKRTDSWREMTPTELSEAVTALKVQAQDLRSSERVLRQTSTFPFGEHRYRSDREESIPLMVSAAIHAQVALAMGAEAVNLYNSALGNGWRDSAGIARLTTAQEILGLHGAFVAWGASNDRASQQIFAEIEAAETVEDIKAIIAAIPTDERWPT